MAMPDPIALDEFLTVLKKHGVSECYQNGNSYRFADELATAAAMRALSRDVRRAEKQEPQTPPPGVVEAAQLDIDDILFGAK